MWFTVRANGKRGGWYQSVFSSVKKVYIGKGIYIISCAQSVPNQ